MAAEELESTEQENTTQEQINARVKLQKRLSQMSQSERDTLVKLVRYDTIMELLDAIKNLKKTSKETWENILKKLKAVADIDTKDGGDIKNILLAMIPLVGALAGTLLALRENERLEIESAEPSDDNNPAKDPSFTAELQTLTDTTSSTESLVLKLCAENSLGFSETKEPDEKPKTIKPAQRTVIAMEPRFSGLDRSTPNVQQATSSQIFIKTKQSDVKDGLAGETL